MVKPREAGADWMAAVANSRGPCVVGMDAGIPAVLVVGPLGGDTVPMVGTLVRTDGGTMVDAMYDACIGTSSSNDGMLEAKTFCCVQLSSATTRRLRPNESQSLDDGNASPLRWQRHQAPHQCSNAAAIDFIALRQA